MCDLRKAVVGGAVRAALAAAGCAILAAAAVAARLDPDPRGYGTHEQLGLPPCLVQVRWGVRCPSCGFTTAWAHAGRGAWRAALAAHAGGTAAWGLGLAWAAWALATALTGTWIAGPPRWGLWQGAAAAVAALSLVDWATSWRL